MKKNIDYRQKAFDMLMEALSLSQARPFTKKWDKKRYEKIFDKYKKPKQKNSYRIYLEPKENIRDVKKDVKPPKDIEDALSKDGYSIEDYEKGLATDGKRVLRIGRLLNKIDPSLLDKFNNDPKRKGSKQSTLSVVISRHPYDIAGMSTDRGWTSCMRLDGGQYCGYVGKDVKEGTIIAYLIDRDDDNIENPKARLLIKPFVNVSDEDEFILGDDKKIYGTDIRGTLRTTVEKWLEEVNGKVKYGKYILNRELYSDGRGAITRMPDKITNKAEVKAALDIWGIKNYTINDDLTVDVDGDVDISGKKLTKIPVKFGKVTGGFGCHFNNLTNLKGIPQIVGGSFRCDNNKLTTLEGSPDKVGGYFWCDENNLTTLKGSPELVGGGFRCYFNNLTTLEGSPEKVGGDFRCENNKLTTLEESPKEVEGNFKCHSNNLITLKGSPDKIGGDFNCSFNNLTTLEGRPKEVGGSFLCEKNKLITLKGSPDKIGGHFFCNNNKLTSLEGSPELVGGDFWCQKNNLTSLEGSPQKVEGTFWCYNNSKQFNEEEVRAVCDVKGNVLV